MRVGPGLLLLAACAAGLGLGSGHAASWPEARIVSESTERLVIAVEVPPYSLETIQANGITYTQVMGTGLAPFAGEGEPNLPVVPVVIAVPPGGGARIVGIERSDERILEGLRIVPVEGFAGRGERETEFAEYEYVEKDSIYGRDSAFPGHSAWLTDRGRLRHQEVVRLVVAPFTYRPASGRLVAAGRVTVTVEIEGGAGAVLEGGAGVLEGGAGDAWEGLYKEAVLNHEQGMRWRAQARRSGATADTGSTAVAAAASANQRVKIVIDRTGFYRLAFDTLAAAGFPQGVAAAQVFMYRDVFTESTDGSPDTLVSMEHAVSVEDNDGDGVFSSGDRLEFFARDFYDEYGRQGNEDLFFDKNIYWVSWGEGEHRRITSRPGWRGAVSPAEPSHFSDFVHVEKDSFFVNFPPEDNMDRFVWTKQRRVTPFDLPGIDTTLSAALKVRFVNFYNYYDLRFPRPSQVVLSMTGCGNPQVAVDTVTTPLPSTRIFDVPLPAGLLCESDNRFRFESSIVDAAASPGNLLDWFEIIYERKYQASDDRLIFTNGGATGEVQFQVGGFAAPDVRLFDVTDAADPVALALGEDQVVPDDGGFKVVFRDSISSARRYMALAASAAFKAESSQLSLKPAPRTRGVTADYLVVCHPDFLSELDPIVSRRTQQGHQVFVAAPEEVYDDFGNGMKSDLAIRRFIKDAFLGGNAAFVLLVGDANTDPRGLLLVPPPGSTQPPSDVDYVPTHAITRLEDEKPNKELRPADNWLVSLDGPSDDYPDLYLGRFPVGSAAEARTVVEKIASFEDDSGEDPWKKRVLLVADDEYKFASGTPGSTCFAGERDFMWACDTVAVVAKDFATVALDTVKYYLKRCVKDDQPERRCDLSSCCTVTSTTQAFTRANCTPALVGLMNQGALLVNYQGHANRDRFTHESLILDGGNAVNPNAYTDIRGLSNRDRPFIFAGYGCWISEFARRSEPQPGVQDAIGEKFLTAVNGGACASFASGCSEIIGTNRLFNPYVARAMFSNLQGLDPQGNPVPARVLIGEVVTAALVRFGGGEYSQRHILFGDPAMIVDMGPPLAAVEVNDSLIDETYVFDGQAFDTLDVVSQIRDEEAIMEINFDLVEGGVPRAVPPGEILIEPLTDLDLARSRIYRASYRHVPALGEYSVRLSAADYAGKQTVFEIGVRTGSAAFYRGEAALEEGGSLVFGQTLRAVVTRPFAFSEGDIVAAVDTVPASEFDQYSVVKLDEDGKQWEVSFVPNLTSGSHAFRVIVDGFGAQRGFEYVTVTVGFSVGGRTLYESDFVSPDARVALLIAAEGESGVGDISVELDGVGVGVAFERLSETEWVGELDLGSSGVGPGEHTLVVRVGEWQESRRFRISEDLGLVDVSVFPNPFSRQTYFYYTLLREAREVRLMVFTVMGRKIVEEEMSGFAGYNQHVWDGRDAGGDEVANGTYIYRVVVGWAEGRREFTGRLVKLD